MAATIFFLVVLVGGAIYITTPDERARLVRAALPALGRLRDVAEYGRLECEPFHDALRERTPRALVTPALVALNATIFVFMLFGAGTLSDPETLVSWGGNFGPRTTNGEWWRLVMALFIHSGLIHLLVSIAGLVQAGLILERLVGPLAFATTYFAAGVLASLVNISADPVAVSVGASGAIFGIYGLLLVSLIWGMLHRLTTTIPLLAVMRLGPAAGVFILYNAPTDSLVSADNMAGLAAGFVCGLALAIGVSDFKPDARRVAVTMAAIVVIAVASAVPLRGISDVRPEIARVVALEDRIASEYQSAVDRFKKDQITPEALAKLIDRTITPELRAARARLKALDGVPHEHQPLVAGADEYLQLRDESWRLRAEGLRKTNMLTLRRAERSERASLEALERIRPADQK